MTTTTDGTETVTVSVTSAMAHLILLRHIKRLPEPKDYETATSFKLIKVELSSMQAFLIWVKAFGGSRKEILVTKFTHRPEDRHTSGWHSIDFHGWRLNLFVDVPRGEKSDSDLDADTVAALQAVA
jgi:hypothetical protein